MNPLKLAYNKSIEGNCVCENLINIRNRIRNVFSISQSAKHQYKKGKSVIYLMGTSPITSVLKNPKNVLSSLKKLFDYTRVLDISLKTHFYKHPLWNRSTPFFLKNSQGKLKFVEFYNTKQICEVLPRQITELTFHSWWLLYQSIIFLIHFR